MIGNLWRRRLCSYCIAVIMVLGIVGPNVLMGQQSNLRDTTRAGRQARITLRVKNLPLKTVIAHIAQQAHLTPLYGNAVAKSEVHVSLDAKNLPVLQAFEQILKGTGLRASINGAHVLIERIAPVDSASIAHGMITGRVIDSATQKGIAGVTVTVVGSNLTVVTKADGAFHINKVPIGSQSVSGKLLGYQTRTVETVIDINRMTTITLLLPQASTTLSEVVTTATGQQRRVEVAHDIVRIDPEVIMQRAPIRSVSDLLEAAQVPGVQVQRQSGDPGAPTKIRIRGIGSISQSNDPVVLLDGVWIDATTGKPSRIDDIDPSTIESIEIARGPSAASLYGLDAANGVIVITTKKGKAGRARWNVSYNRDWGQTYGAIPRAYAGVGHNPATGASMWCPIEKIISFDCIQDSVVVYDPNNTLLGREGTETNHRFVVQVDGGSGAVTYAITATANNTIGVRRIAPVDLIRLRKLGYDVKNDFARPSALNRRNITSSLTLMPRDNLTLGFTVTGTQTNLKDNSYQPTFGVENIGRADRDYSLDTLTLLSRGNTILANENPTRNSAAIFGGTAQWRPRGTWVVNGTVGLERNISETSTYSTQTQCNYGNICVDTFGNRSELSENKGTYTARLNTSTNLNLGWLGRFLEVRPAIGGDFRKTQIARLVIVKGEIPPGERSITAGQLTSSEYNRVANATAGWYLNSMIGLFRRVYFDLGIRQDIGSAITSSSNSNYPKLGGSWLISDEPFWRQNRLVNLLRLRAAIGYSAVQPDIADIQGRYVSGYEFVNGRFVRTVDLQNVGNPQLEPERAMEFELGFDADVWDGRVNVIATYAHSENQNTLVTRTLPPSAGGTFTSIRKENIARIQNRGIELSIDARAIETRNMLVVLNYGLNLSDNIVKGLGNGVLPFSDRSVSRIQEGYPLAGAWARRVLGYRDSNEDRLLARDEVILSDSAVYLGSGRPRYTSSYGVSITLGNQFTFDARFAYQSQYVQQYQKNNGYAFEDQNAPLPDQAYAVIENISGRRPVSDLRWSSASVTYQIPRQILSLLHARSLSVSLQGSNLALWTNYVGRDPGVNSAILSSEVMADDGKTVPRPRLFVLNFRFGF